MLTDSILHIGHSLRSYIKASFIYLRFIFCINCSLWSFWMRGLSQISSVSMSVCLGKFVTIALRHVKQTTHTPNTVLSRSHAHCPVDSRTLSAEIYLSILTSVDLNQSLPAVSMTAVKCACVDDCGLAPLNQSSPFRDTKSHISLCQSVSLGEGERAKETKIIYLTCIRFPSWPIYFCIIFRWKQTPQIDMNDTHGSVNTQHKHSI